MSSDSQPNNQETRQEMAAQSHSKESAITRMWIDEIDQGKKRHKEFWTKCEKISKKLVNEKLIDAVGTTTGRRYNVLWSIFQTLQPNLFSELPTPYIERAFSDDDPAARDAALLQQRALQNDLQGDELYDAVSDATDEFALFSRGTLWAKYSPIVKMRESEATKGEMVEFVAHEEVDWECIPFDHFLHGAAGKWRHVPWVARLVPMTRDELLERFQERGKECPLQFRTTEGGEKDKNNEFGGLFARAEVWEVWDKVHRKVIWICPQCPDYYLDQRDDFLKLRNFFPCPKPAFGTIAPNRTIPTPEYVIWQDVAEELDEVTLRIKLLTEAIRVAGAYNQAMGEDFKKIISGQENELVPIDSWVAFAEGGGLKGNIDWLPIEQIAKVADVLRGHRSQLVQELYEITGLSDIIRGTSDPRETAKAQQIKGQYASLRLKRKQRTLARMVREAYEVHAEIMCTHYSDDTIMECSTAQALLVDDDGNFDLARWQSAIAVIRANKTRGFRIKIDNETLAGDRISDERDERGFFVQTVTGLLQSGMQMSEQYPATMKLVKQIVMFGVKSFPVGRSMEASIERALDQMIDEAEAPKQPEPPPPTMTPEELELENARTQVAKEKVGVDRQRLILEEKIFTMEHELELKKIAAADGARQRDLDLKAQRDVASAGATQSQAETARMQADTARFAAQSQARRDQEQARQQKETAFQTAERELLKLLETRKSREEDNEHRVADRQHDGAHRIADRRNERDKNDGDRDVKMAAAKSKARSSAT